MTPSNPAVWPTLQAHDAPALIQYLVETLGFVLTVRYDDDDRVAHAQLNWPEGTGGLMMGSYKPGTDWCREPGTAGAYIVTADADALHARATARNADVVRSLCTTDYGSREFAVRDPEGNLWSFGSYPGEPPQP